MLRMRSHSSNLSNYYPVQRSIKQICHSIFDSKKQILLLTLFLFTIPTIYILSHTPSEAQIIENPDTCSKLIEIIYNSNRTLCSEAADRRGNKQRIIALTIFGPKENPIFIDDNFSQLITPLLNEARLLFPTWTIRLYADASTIHRLNLNNLTRLSTNIDVCNVNQIPMLGNIGEFLSGKLWRFLPALDPTVDFISSRDLDSPLIEREQVLIERFMNSSYLFLSIRDHPLHGIPILGGLWTAALYRNRLLFLHLFSVLLDKHKIKRYSLAHDQTLLGDLIWPKVKKQTLVFDSYTCPQFSEGDQHAFPTQRPSRECHLGCVRPCCEKNSTKIVLTKPCPKQCRPKDHPDWIYC
jgi:hypothetical protein